MVVMMGVLVMEVVTDYRGEGDLLISTPPTLLPHGVATSCFYSMMSSLKWFLVLIGWSAKILLCIILAPTVKYPAPLHVVVDLIVMVSL